VLGTFPKIRLFGDKERARDFYGLAMQQMEVLLNLMSFRDIKIDVRKLRIENDGWIKLSVNYDAKLIEIYYPPGYEVRKEEKKRWEPWNGGRNYICVDHLWEFTMRTGLSYPVAFHSTVTDYYGAAPQPGSGYPGIAAGTNPSLCNLEYTWPVSGSEVDHFYWPHIGDGKLQCTVYPEQANAYYDYRGFNVIWDNRTTGGSPGDPINPYTNANAQFCELSVNVFADADEGYGFSEPATVLLSSATAFYMSDGSNVFVWYLGIDQLLYNDNGFIPPGDRPYISTLGDAFNVGANGVFVLQLSDYGFTGDIVRVGFNFEYPGLLGKKGDPGRNMVLICDYIDFY